MSGLMPPNPLSYEGQVVVSSIAKPFAPTTSFINFNVPTIWADTEGEEAYILVSKAGGSATWTPITGQSAIQTLSADSGSATGDTVKISGGTTGLTTIASSSTMDIIGTLNVANGGTGANTLTANGVLYGSGTSAIGATNAGTTGTVLIGTTGSPSFSTAVNGAGNFAFTSSTSGTSRSVTIENTDATSSLSNAVLFLVTLNGGGQSYVSAAISGVVGYSWGISTAAGTPLVETNSNTGITSGSILRSMSIGGQQSLPLQSAFSSQLSYSVTNATGDGTAVTLICNSTFYDQNSEYNTSTGVVTFKQSGKYLFCVTIALGNLGIAHTTANAYIHLGTAPTIFQVFDINAGVAMDASNNLVLSGSALLPVAVSDTAYVVVTVSGSTKTIRLTGTTSNAQPYCAFSAIKLV